MFRFTIRDVLWLTALVAVSVGWWSWWRSLPPPDARATGAVSVNGTPLEDGQLCLHSVNGPIFGACITKGQFQIPRVPVGTFRVTIEGSGVPARYAGANSELTIQISGAMNQLDFSLAGK